MENNTAATKTYAVTIRDAGVCVEQTIEAEDIHAAVDAMEKQMREADEVYADDPDCEPRTEWSAIITDGVRAECSLKEPGRQDAQAWAHVQIVEA